ncbi:MAG: N-formylglutamate amidohydrolase, partial [Pseudomonadota bacterium]
TVPQSLWQAMCDPLVDLLFADAPGHGAALLTAEFPRVYVDANRADDDIDPTLFDGWDGPASPSEKSTLGKGLFWLNVKPDRTPLYDRTLTGADLHHRIKTYHAPYHAALAALIDQCHGRSGVAFHLNCHSMRGVSGTLDAEGPGVARTDIVLSDRDGTASGPAFMATARDLLVADGFSVAINDPFKGAEIIRRTGAPDRGRHAVQIEINRRLYLEGDGLTPNEDFDGLQDAMSRFVARLAAFCSSEMVKGLPQTSLSA